MKAKFLLLLFLFAICPTIAQKNNLIDKIKKNLEQRQVRKDSIIGANQPYLSFMAGPGYTPEGGLLLGGGVLFTFSTEPGNKNMQRSAIPLMGSISTRGNIGLSSSINTFWLNDMLRAKILLKVSNIRDDYFGVGYENNAEITRGEATSRYENSTFKIEPKINIRFISDLFLGLAYRYNSYHIKNVNPLMANDPNYLEYGSKIHEAGPVFEITYDSRDLVVNAYSGMYLMTSFFKSLDKMGGNQNFEEIVLDARFYQTLNRKGNTLAFRVYGKQTFGAVPFTAMTLIGSTDLLRGYLNGQYRDKTGLVMVTEWRRMFLKKNGNLSKTGMVLWMGTGSIGENFEKLHHWLPNAGVGFRYQIQPRMNVRIDFGLGKNSSGLYFNFTEAF